MGSWQRIAKTEEIPPGEGRAFAVDGRLIAVFRTGDSYYAINDLCPHMGASLSEGYLEDGAVTCPWHAWRFCVKDGAWLDNPKASVRTETFPVRIEGEDVFVDLSPETPHRPDGVVTDKSPTGIVEARHEDRSGDPP